MSSMSFFSFDMFKPVLNMIYQLTLVLFGVLAALIAPFFIMTFLHIFILFCKGWRRKKAVYRKTWQEPKKIKLLYWDFPKKLAEDWFKRNPDAMNEYGVHIISGEQGSGKSMFAVWFIKRLKKMYPGLIYCSNIDLDGQDFQITSPNDFMNRDNGELGMIIFLDEIQNWFGTNESRNFDVNMLQEISQQRKQRKIFIGTSQVFTRVAKPIREQTTTLYKPLTFANCLSIVRVIKPKLNEDGTVKKESLRRLYFFIHTDELRNSYNTLEKVKRQVIVSGQKPIEERIPN